MLFTLLLLLASFFSNNNGWWCVKGTCVETTTADFFIIEFGGLTTDYMEPIDTSYIWTETETEETTEYAATITDTFWEEVYIPTTQIVLLEYAVHETFVASETTVPGTEYSGETSADMTVYSTLTLYVTSTTSITIPTATLNLLTTFSTVINSLTVTTTRYDFADVTSTVIVIA